MMIARKHPHPSPALAILICCIAAAFAGCKRPSTPPSNTPSTTSVPTAPPAPAFHPIQQISDLSGHGHDGTAGIGFDEATSPTSNGLYAAFNRYSDTIHLAGNVSLTNQATYEATVLITQLAYSEHGEGGIIWNVWTDNVQDTRLEIHDGGQVGAFSYPVNNANVMKSGTLQTGVWYNLAYVYDGSEERVYVNGTLVDSRPAQGFISVGGSTGMTLGAIARNGGVVGGFLGRLAGVRISDTARYSGNSYLAISGPGVFSSDPHTQALYNFAPAQMTTDKYK